MHHKVTLTIFSNGGAVLFVCNGIPHSVLNVADLCDSDTEVVAVTATFSGYRFTVTSVYVHRHRPAAKAAALVHALEKRSRETSNTVVTSMPTIVCGETPRVTRGDASLCKLLRSGILPGTLCLYPVRPVPHWPIKGRPTFFRPSSSFSTIDVTAHSSSLPITWIIAPDTMGSDHYPIFLDVPWFSRSAARRATVGHN